MSNASVPEISNGEISNGPFVKGPIDLKCSNCGRPLQIAKMKNGDYALGHLNAIECRSAVDGTFKRTIAIHDKSVNEIIEDFFENPVLVR